MKRILLVTTAHSGERELAERLSGEIPDGATVRVVAPAARLSWLEWLTNDEDRARVDAGEAAEAAVGAASGGATVDAGGVQPDSEAPQAIRDALREFQPDEILLVKEPGDDATWVEELTERAALKDSQVPVRVVEVRAS